MFGFIGDIVGGLIGRKNAKDANAQNAENQELAIAANREAADREYERQKEFAQMGIRWRSADAAAAGLHPLAALGAAGSSYSPTVAVNQPHQIQPDNSIGEAISKAGRSLDAHLANEMGQNTTRAQVATQNPFERQMQVLSLRRAELQNQLIEGQIAAQWASVMGQPGTPAMASSAGPTSGVVVSPVREPYTVPRALVSIEPSKGVSASRNNAGVEAASTPFAKSFDLGHGLRVRLPSQQASEPLEALGPLGWIAGSVLNGLSAARERWLGPEGGPPHPSMRWDRWRGVWTNR